MYLLILNLLLPCHQRELCYAPPVGSAKDPVNIAGMAAQNVIDGFVEQVDWSQLKAVASLPDVVVLDVRNTGEVDKAGKLIDGAINIPLNDLRQRLSEIPEGERVVVSCASGQRAYYATRILKQSGKFSKVENLSGAWKTFSLAQNRV
jgi:rhodanese-related sulfurtransferase